MSDDTSWRKDPYSHSLPSTWNLWPDNIGNRQFCDERPENGLVLVLYADYRVKTTDFTALLYL